MNIKYQLLGKEHRGDYEGSRKRAIREILHDKMASIYAGHVLRGSSGTNDILTLEGSISEVRARGPQEEVTLMISKNG